MSFSKGIAAINWSFFVNLPVPVGEKGGGIFNFILGSLYIVTMSCIIAIPWGISIGIFLYDSKNLKLAYWVRLCVEVLQALPSIVVGIVAYVWLVIPMKTFFGYFRKFCFGTYDASYDCSFH